MPHPVQMFQLTFLLHAVFIDENCVVLHLPDSTVGGAMPKNSGGPNNNNETLIYKDRNV